jgi:hypothetical protein
MVSAGSTAIAVGLNKGYKGEQVTMKAKPSSRKGVSLIVFAAVYAVI